MEKKQEITMENQAQNQLALIKKDVVDTVTNKVREFTTAGETSLPRQLQRGERHEERLADPPGDQGKNAGQAGGTGPELLHPGLHRQRPAEHGGPGAQPSQEAMLFHRLRQPAGLPAVLLRQHLPGQAGRPEIEDIVGTTVYEGDEFEYYIYRGRPSSASTSRAWAT